MERRDLLMSASRSDLAHLWMNFAKIMLLVAFVYQGVLTDQLGLRLLGSESYFVLYPDASVDPATGESTSAARFVEETALDRPEFKVHFVPVSLGLSARYDEVELEVTDVWRVTEAGERLPLQIAPEKDSRTRSYVWPEGSRRPLYSAAFDLSQVVRENLEPSEYEVAFDIRFMKDGQVVHRSSAGAAGSAGTVALTVRSADDPRFGEIVVARRQSFEVPQRLREMTDCVIELPGGSEVSCNQERIGIGTMAPGRYAGMPGSFRKDDARIPFSMDFIIQENQAPRAIRDPQDPGFLRLFTDDWVVDTEENRRFINLSQFVVDNDGKNADGTPNVQVRSMEVVGTTDFGVERVSAASWQLVPLVANPRVNQQFELRADDEFSRDPITVEYARGRN